MARTEEDNKKLIHELQVQQVELEIQNEELRSARKLAEDRYQRYVDLYDFAPVGYLTLDSSGKIKEVNLTATRLLGVPRYRLVNSRFEFFVTIDDRQTFHSFLRKVFEGKRNESCELTLKKQAVLTHLEAAAQPGGQVCRAVLTDISRRAKDESEIRRLNTKLGQHVSELETVNKELETFSYSVSHDLRAPLRHIAGFVKLMEKGLVNHPDHKMQRYMDIIARAAGWMDTLINDLLSFAHLARSELKMRKLNLNTIIKEIVKEMELETKDRKIRWKIEKLPEVYGDEILLKTVFVNLVSNAVKYTLTRLQAEIRIGYREEPQEFVFFIKDNGVGFDKKYMERLFGVFQRLDSKEEFEGTGIGLANVHRIISRHGGRTWADAAVDKGATFYFSLPKADI